MEQTLRQICAELQISRRTIQGYEKMGLVVPSGRNKYGHLLYDASCREQIRTVRFYQQMGFSLKEIKWLLAAENAMKKAALEKRVERLEQDHARLHQIILQAKMYIAML